MPKKTLPKFNYNYRHTRMLLEDFQPSTHWIVVKEELERNSETGIIIPDKHFATIGTIMAVGPEGKLDGIAVGDKVMYEQWQGGKWAFTIKNPNAMIYDELECLIMSVDSIWAIIK